MRFLHSTLLIDYPQLSKPEHYRPTLASSFCQKILGYFLATGGFNLLSVHLILAAGETFPPPFIHQLLTDGQAVDILVGFIRQPEKHGCYRSDNYQQNNRCHSMVRF